MNIFQKFKEKLESNFLKDKNFAELLKGSASAFSLKIISMIIGYVTMVFITNKFGAEKYGVLALAITVLSIGVIIPRFGLDTSIVKIIGSIKNYTNRVEVNKIIFKAALITFITGIIVSTLLFYFSDDISKIVFDKPHFSYELKIVSWLIIPTALIFLTAGYFQAYKNIKRFILINTTLLNLFFFIFIVAASLLKYEIELFKVYAFAIMSTFFVGLILWLLKNRKTKKNVVDKTKADTNFTVGRIIKISSPMLFSSSFALLISWIDIIMLGMFAESKSIGIYSASQRLAAISGIALFAINAISTPKFVEFYSKNDLIGLEKTVQNSTRLIFFTTTPILLIFLIFSKSILGINGSEFELGYIALIFLCLGKFVNSISGSVGYILQMTDNQKIFQNVLMFAALLNLGLNYLLIPKYGFNGAAFASFITVATWNIILIIIIKKRLGFWTIYIPFLKLNNR